jgi:plastocyanin
MNPPMKHRLRAILVLLAAPLLLALPAAAGARTADDPVLIGTVGSAGAADSFHITLTDASGNALIRIPAGEYTVQVHDFSSIHNFHLFGPGGVSMSTEVDAIGDATWTVTLVNGTYTFQCDAHALQMHGSFAVGPPPPPPTKLTARVAAGGVVSLRKAGAAVPSLAPGRYLIAVADTSKKENFHVTGPGVNTKTGLAFKGAKTLAVTFKRGVYRYRSDAHPKLGRSVKVVAPGTPR